MREKWMLLNKKADFHEIGKKYNITPLLAKCIVNRGITQENEIQKYLYGSIQDLYSPWDLKDITKAVEVINQARQEKNLTAIATDFDCDGIFSAFVLHKAFEKLGIEHIVFFPDRVTEGYGINNRIVEEAKEKGAGLIVTCDNGIAALEPLAYAKEIGLSVVVTDHHEIQGELPKADAIVNPKREDCEYPFKGLCGAGVAYKLVECLYETNGVPKEELHELLEYTSIATVADVMDLVDENRIIVREGLKIINHTKNIGLQSLIELNVLNEKEIDTYHIGFVIGPCFNAAGRLDTARTALDLLMETDKAKAKKMASQLKSLNDSRKSMTNEGVEQAKLMIETSDLKNDSVLVIRLDDCHESLVGIIAGRIKEYYHKPAIVFAKTEDGLKGSGRSIEAYNMFERLLEQKELLERFGGHPMAAGLSIREENFEPLKNALNEKAGLVEKDFVPVVEIDAAMPLGYISEEIIHSLNLLKPIGKGNGKPTFAEQHFFIKRAVKRGSNHNVLSLKVVNHEGCSMDAIYFGDVLSFDQFIEENYGAENLNNIYSGKKNSVDIAFSYYPEVNEYNGVRTIQIKIISYCKIES